MPKKSTVSIDAETQSVLNRGSLIHQDPEYYYTLPQQLDRDLYQKVNRVLNLSGGKWNRGAGAHVFPIDPTEKLSLALAEGMIVDQKKLHQQFFTPDDVAEALFYRHIQDDLEALHLHPDSTKGMDPSAGEGALARMLARYIMPKNVLCVEIDDYLQKGLLNDGYSLVPGDFLQVPPAMGLRQDVIYMNPPFTNNQDIDHVLHAFRFLKPGASLYAIMSPSWMYGTTQKQDRWRSLFGTFGKMLEQLPEGTFKESGTQIRTVFIKLTHPNW